MLPYDDPQRFLDPHFHFAVVVAENDAVKSGFQIYQMLRQWGFSVVPVNPRERNVQGDFCFSDLHSVRPFPDVVVLTKSAAAQSEFVRETLRTMRDNGIFRLWAEPSTLTTETKRFALENNISVLDTFSLAQELLKIPPRQQQ